MKTTYNGPGFNIEHDAKDLKEAFAFIGRCKELFGLAEVCENCKGTKISPRYSKSQAGHEFYSLQCHNCKWEFKLGQRKSDGQLFPKGWEPGYESESAPSSDRETVKQELERSSPF